jgi:hypothetical protein
MTLTSLVRKHSAIAKAVMLIIGTCLAAALVGLTGSMATILRITITPIFP